MRPYDTNTEAELLAMECDNFGDRDKWSILNTADSVSLHPPHPNNSDFAYVMIPKDQFRAIVDWFMRDQP